MENQVAARLVDVIGSSPKAGLDLASSLLREQRVDAMELVAPNQTFLDALFSRAISQGYLFASALSRELFLFKGHNEFHQASSHQLLTRKNSQGDWPLVELIEAFEDARAARKKGVRSAVDMDGYRKSFDGFLSGSLKHMPQDFWDEVGGAFMSSCFSNGFKRAANEAWKYTSPLSLDRHGRPAIMAATTIHEWQRFIEENHDPEARIGDDPLWQILLKEAKVKPTNSATSFLGGFEDWFVSWARAQKALKNEILELAKVRMAKPREYGGKRWVSLFRASDDKWFSWTTKSGIPVWEIASGCGEEFFDAMDQSPDLISKIDQDRYHCKKVQWLLYCLCENKDNNLEASRSFANLVESKGWPPELAPYLMYFLSVEMNDELRSVIDLLKASNPSLWWGDADLKEIIGKDLFLRVDKIAKDKAHMVPSIIEYMEGSPSPWLNVSKGFLGSLRGGAMTHIQSINREYAAYVARDQDGVQQLEKLRMSFNGVRRKEYMSWLDSVKLAAASITVKKSGSSLRL